MNTAPFRLCATVLGLLLAAGCAGDIGGDTGLPTCNARPVDPGGWEFLRSTRVEGSDHAGRTYAYRGPGGGEVTFFFGVDSDAGAGLPTAGGLALATAGTGTLLGHGTEWALLWNGVPPCDPNSATGTGLTKDEFVLVLQQAHVLFPEEEEGEGQVPGGEGGEIEEELEGEELEGVIPPGGPAVEWVAVFDSAGDRGDLDPGPEELEEAGDNVVTSAASCWKGLPQRLGSPRDSYVSAITAITKNELEFLVERVALTPIFYGQLRARC